MLAQLLCATWECLLLCVRVIFILKKIAQNFSVIAGIDAMTRFRDLHSNLPHCCLSMACTALSHSNLFQFVKANFCLKFVFPLFLDVEKHSDPAYVPIAQVICICQKDIYHTLQSNFSKRNKRCKQFICIKNKNTFSRLPELVQ